LSYRPQIDLCVRIKQALRVKAFGFIPKKKIVIRLCLENEAV
jgi:hypothetical protein